MEPKEKVKRELEERDLASRLEGRNGGLRPSKPKAKDDDGLTQFVWRQATFHSGNNPSMPVMSYSWLQGWLDEENIDARVIGTGDEAGDEVLDVISAHVDHLLENHFGLDPAGAAKRWKDLI